ncbi:MAG: GGDEF domain-containing protein [Actinobacteria bacterium]|nr:GGDEF domain-containing protein [Actinomycetota bacterium]MCG2803118.1 GGDEF domain-containing protein [Cellulomonas sp.]
MRLATVPSARVRYLVLAEAAGGALAVLGALVPRAGVPAVSTTWGVTGIGIGLLALVTWVLRQHRRVLVVSLGLVLAAVALLLAVTPDPAAAATLALPLMLGGQLGALLLPMRRWRWLAWYSTALAVVAVVLSPAGLDVPQMIASVALVGLGQLLIGRVYAQVHDQATTDALTGAYSRAVLDRTVGSAIRAACSGARVSLAVLDLDGLKELNDTGGHAAGDRALIDVVRVLRDALDAEDIVARLGGDEFVVLFADQDGRSAARWLTRVRERSAHAWSFGVTQVRADDTVLSVLKRADDALYRHKARTDGDTVDAAVGGSAIE